MSDEVKQVDRLVARLIGEATLAGAYRQATREDPRLAGGFGKLADRHASNAAELGEEIARWVNP